MTNQAIYRKTDLTPDDIINAYMQGNLETFDVKPRLDGVHIMLYPDQYPNVKIQVLRDAANIWAPSFGQLDEVEDMLNGILGNGFNPSPFKERDVKLSPGELRKIVESPLGLVSTFMHYFPSVIADAMCYAIECMDKCNSWVNHP